MEKSTRLLLVCTLAITSTLACRLLSAGILDDDQTPAASPIPLATPLATSPASFPCENPYYPVKTGSTWRYASTGSMAGEFSFSDTITAIDEEGFTLTSQINGMTRTQEWACKQEGLLALQIDPDTATGLTTDQVQINLTTLNATGITIPANITPGDKWAYQLDLEGNISLAGTVARATGTARYAFTALNKENVSVPAGTFEAVKIDSDVTIDFQINIAGISTPVSFTSTASQWLVPGIGTVRTTSASELDGTSYQETIELQSFSIPD